MKRNVPSGVGVLGFEVDTLATDLSVPSGNLVRFFFMVVEYGMSGQFLRDQGTVFLPLLIFVT